MTATQELLSSRIPTETSAPAISNDLLSRLPADLRNDARALVRDVRAVAEGLREARRRATMELAPRIAELKERLCARGGDRTKPKHLGLVTWEEFVAEAFGVSDQTIQNWLDAYEARCRFVTLLNGDEVKYTKTDPVTKVEVEVVVAPDKFSPEKLQAELDEVDLGNKPAARAWAGLLTGQTAGSKRAPIDHLKVWKNACVALRPANYQALIGKQKTVAVTALSEVLVQLPSDVRETLAFELKQSLGRSGK